MEPEAPDWLQAASALAVLGFDVTVLDPDADDGMLWDEDPAHGVIRVVQNPAATGWLLTVTEPPAVVQ